MPVVATEDFSGALDTTLAGKTTTTGGLVWFGVGPFATNRAGLKLTGAGALKSTVNDSGAAINTGSANHYAQGRLLNIQTTNAYTGLLLAATDANNYILVAPLGASTVRVIKRIAGVTTVVNTISTPLVVGDVLRAEKLDGVVKVYKNGAQIGLTAGYSITDAAVSTVTNAGIWAPVFIANADIMDDFESGTLGGTEPPSLTIGSGPSVNQVYQRSPGASSKAVPFSGTYAGTAPTDIQAQIETVGGVVISAWSTVSGATIGSGSWAASVTVPQRPEWLVVKLRTRDSGGATLAQATSSQFGVGVLVMIDGQSNAVNLGAVSGGTAPSVPFAKWTGSAWATTTNGAGERALIQELASQLGVIVGVGNSAANGTGISAHVPPAATHWLSTTNMLTAMGGDCELMVWMQGESDAAAGADVSASYSTALQSIADGMLTATGRTAAQFRLLVGVMGRNDGGSGTNVGWQSVRIGQVNAATAHAAIDISHDCIDLSMTDTLHYDAAGCAEAGYRFARSALKWLGVSTHDARGPRIASASRTGSTVTVALDLNGSASLTGSAPLTGWEFYNGTVWAAATDAAVVGDTVQFTGAGATAVRYLYGSDPDVSALARGNLTPSASSSIGLPVEPTRADVAVSASATVDFGAGADAVAAADAGGSALFAYTLGAGADAVSTADAGGGIASGLLLGAGADASATADAGGSALFAYTLGAGADAVRIVDSARGITDPSMQVTPAGTPMLSRADATTYLSIAGR